MEWVSVAEELGVRGYLNVAGAADYFCQLLLVHPLGRSKILIKPAFLAPSSISRRSSPLQISVVSIRVTRRRLTVEYSGDHCDL